MAHLSSNALSAPLRLRPFRRLVTAYGVNALGNWLGEIALAVLVLQRTGSVAIVAGAWVAGQFAPAFAVPALVTRLERAPSEYALPALLAFEALTFALLAATADRLPIALVLVLLACDGAAGLAARAVIKASIVNVTTPAGLSREGNTILIGVFSACMAVGPVVAGVLVAAFSPQMALLGDAITFALAALLLGVGAGLPRTSVEEAPLGARLRAGLAYVHAEIDLRRLLSAYAVVSVLAAMVVPLEIVFITRNLGGSEAAYGAVLGAWGAGSVAGSALLGLIRKA